MAIANIAGRAGFLLGLDATELKRGLRAAARDFDTATAQMAVSADRAGRAVGESRGAAGGVGLAGRLGGMGALLGRAGLYGVGITAAIQLNQELTQSLNVTGSEAFTTEGKIRNMASALLSGDIVGGIKALNTAPQTFEDLGISAQDAAGHIDALRLASENIGGKWDLIYRQALDVADAYRQVAAASRAAIAAATTFRDQQGAPIFQGGFAGLRPQPPAGPGPTTFGTPIQTPAAIGPSARLQARLTVAQASGDLDEVLRLQTVQRDRLAKALENSHGNVQQREKLNQQLAAATAVVIQTQRAIDAQEKAEADAAARAREAARADAERAREEARADAERAARERAERQRRAREAALRARLDEAESISIGARKQVEGRFPLGENRLRRIDPAALDAATQTAGGPTLADLSAMFRGFLTDFTRIQGDFAANFSGGAGLNTVVLEQLTRTTNTHLERAALTRHHRSILELDQAAVMS